MAEERLWLTPDYFADFHCKGGACRNSCCSGWSIAVNQRDYFRLIGMDCAPELHRKLECAFQTPDFPSPERYRLISPNWLGRCPMQDDDGLCALHRGCGEGALPEICRVYPRSFKREGGKLRACCSNSCEAVVETLMEKDALDFRLLPLAADAEISDELGAEGMESIHRSILLLQDRSQALRERIAAVCRELGCDENFVSGEQGLKRLMAILSEIRSESRNLSEYGAAAFERYQGADAWAAYCADLERMTADHPRWQQQFENILVNHAVYIDFPFADRRITPKDACAGLCLLYSAMLAVVAAHCSVHREENAFADAIAGLFHLAEHSAFYYNIRIASKNERILL